MPFELLALAFSPKYEMLRVSLGKHGIIIWEGGGLGEKGRFKNQALRFSSAFLSKSFLI